MTGYYSTHVPQPQPPFVREAPAYFRRHRQHYLLTSGTTGYHPNPSEAAIAPSLHGPYTVVGDVHPSDSSRTSFHTQISSVFKHSTKKDVFIALGDRWLPSYQEHGFKAHTAFEHYFAPGRDGDERMEEFAEVNTSVASYVWLPITFENDRLVVAWRDQWRLDEFEDR